MSLEIAAIGDIGIYDQKVKSLAKSIPDHQISFLALLGDNFYPTGIQNGKEWDQYLKAFGHLKVPVYPILGNHGTVVHIHPHVPSGYDEPRWAKRQGRGHRHQRCHWRCCPKR